MHANAQHAKSDVTLWVGNLTRKKPERQMKIFPGLQHIVKQDFRTFGLTVFIASFFPPPTGCVSMGHPTCFPFETSCSFRRRLCSTACE